MKLTVLGMFGPYPDKGAHAASGYLVEDGDDCLIMDMGSGALSRLRQTAEVKKIKSIFFSHLHYDHTSDFLPFRYLLEDLQHTVTVYTAFDSGEWYKLLFSHPNIKVVNVDSSSRIALGEMKLSFFDMNHTVPDLAVRIEGSKTLVYTGDTMNNPNIELAAAGADCLLADCSKPAGFNGPHMTAPEAIALHEKTGIRIISTHLSPGYSPQELYAAYPGIEVAEELKTYEI